MCCSDTGYCFNFDLYEGKKATESPILGLGASVVLNMIAKVNVLSYHSFYFANFFTSFDLMKVLTERSISASCTVRINRTNKFPLSTDDNLKKQDRGFYDYRMDSNSDIVAVVWKDNNNVKMLSNHQGTLPAQNVKRWSRQNKKQVTLNQPKCIADYNSHMGGVDKMDWLINKYRIKIRAKEWYFLFFTNMIDMAVVNTHVLYCMAKEKIPLLKFRRSIVRVYMKTLSVSDPRNSGRSSLNKNTLLRVPEEVRRSESGHALERTVEGKQRKCAVCKNNVRKQWIKCNVGLHVNFYLGWHQEMSDIQTHTKVLL